MPVWKDGPATRPADLSPLADDLTQTTHPTNYQGATPSCLFYRLEQESEGVVPGQGAVDHRAQLHPIAHARRNCCSVRVSRSHLTHAFGTATGMSVMRYVRARRLSAAARALAAGASDILSIALEAGYGSHEAFTRAFRDRFGQTPESVRARRSVDGLALVGPLELRPVANVRLDPPRVVDDRIVRVVGLAERCSFNTTINIPAQ